MSLEETSMEQLQVGQFLQEDTLYATSSSFFFHINSTRVKTGNHGDAMLKKVPMKSVTTAKKFYLELSYIYRLF